MIVKIQRPTFPPDAAWLITDQTLTVQRHVSIIPHRVAESCRFGKAYWTARFIDGSSIEFLQQIGPQAW